MKKRPRRTLRALMAAREQSRRLVAERTGVNARLKSSVNRKPPNVGFQGDEVERSKKTRLSHLDRRVTV